MAVSGFDCAHLQFSDTSVSSATTQGAMEQVDMGDVIERAVKPGVRKSLLFGSAPLLAVGQWVPSPALSEPHL